MERYRPKKSLGQHFLTSPYVIREMVTSVTPDDVVLEIGPGEGILTREILDTGCIIHAIEKDTDLIPILKEKFAHESETGKFILHHIDVLKFDTKRLPIGYKIIANIPYYITGAIMRYFLEDASNQPKHMTLLIQKEVADRIMARDKKESLLSLSVRAYSTPKYIKTVSRGAFRPAPAVDSAIIALENISKNNFKNKAEEKAFFELIHLGFGHKRKTLWHNFAPLGETMRKNIFKVASLDPKIRAEDISLQIWLLMVKSYKNIKK